MSKHEEKIKELAEKVSKAKRALDAKIDMLDPDMDPEKRAELHAKIDGEFNKVKAAMESDALLTQTVDEIHALAKSRGINIGVMALYRDVNADQHQRMISFHPEIAGGTFGAAARRGIVESLRDAVIRQDAENKVTKKGGPHGPDCECDE